MTPPLPAPELMAALRVFQQAFPGIGRVALDTVQALQTEVAFLRLQQATRIHWVAQRGGRVVGVSTSLAGAQRAAVLDDLLARARPAPGIPTAPPWVPAPALTDPVGYTTVAWADYRVTPWLTSD